MRDNKNNTGFHKLLLSFQNDTIKGNTIPFLPHLMTTFYQNLAKKKEAGIKVLASQLSLDCRARRSG